VVSKFQIMFESKAQADEKAQHTLKYVSILKRSATQLSDIRWGFGTIFRNIPHLCQKIKHCAHVTLALAIRL
jgi:hypothetical protein